MITKKLTILFALIGLLSFSNCKNNATKNIVATNQQEKPSIKRQNTIEFAKNIKETVQLVDVRTPKEYKNGHIENAKNINVFDKNFIAQMSKYNKDEAIYVYCRSGGRSMKAAKMLVAKGYNVVNLDGGFIGWNRTGYKTIK